MKWAVYWEEDEIECVFFATETEARVRISTLISDYDDRYAGEEERPDWAITLLQVRAEVRQVLYGCGDLSLVEVK